MGRTKFDHVVYHYGIFYDTRVEETHHQGPRGDYYHYALLLEGKLVAFGDEQGNYAGGETCTVVRSGVAAMKKVLASYKGRELYDLIPKKIHPTGMPDENGTLGQLVYISPKLLKQMEKDAAKGIDMPNLTQALLLETNLNLTTAAKWVEKAKGPVTLVDWLKFINRKCIALINASVKDENSTGKKDTL